jgi:hypothetical protein
MTSSAQVSAGVPDVTDGLVARGGFRGVPETCRDVSDIAQGLVVQVVNAVIVPALTPS